MLEHALQLERQLSELKISSSLDHISIEIHDILLYSTKKVSHHRSFLISTEIFISELLAYASLSTANILKKNKCPSWTHVAAKLSDPTRFLEII